MRLVLTLCFFLSTLNLYAKSSSRIDIDDYSLNNESDSGVIFSPGVTYLSINESNSVPDLSGTGSNTRNISFYDLKLGHVFNNGIYFGVAYAIENQKVNSGGDYGTDRTSFGLSFGYKYEGFLGILHYYLNSKQDIDSATDPARNYADGTGLQVDLSYHWFFGNYFGIGPMLTYKNFWYKKAEAVTTGTDSSANSNHSIILPMVNMIIYFYRS